MAAPPRAIIVAKTAWNDTGINLVAGARYRMSATGTWHDRQYRAGPEGMPPQNFVQRLLAPLLRFGNGHYMTLIGCINQDMGSAIAIGESSLFKASQDGRLWCFANDLRIAYGNNSGAIELVVERLYR